MSAFRVSRPPPPRVRFHRSRRAPGRGILHVEEATIEEISGHIGDFKVKAVVDGKRLVWRTDIICLTDENVLSLSIPEDLVGLKKFYRYNFAFFHTPQPGLYRVLPRTLNRVNAFEAGAALAAQVARGSAEVFLKDHELSPRVDPERCRGCGRCVEICPFDAIHLRAERSGVLYGRGPPSQLRRMRRLRGPLSGHGHGHAVFLQPAAGGDCVRCSEGAR